MRRGIQLDELWRVARGEIKLRDFEASTSNGNGATSAQAPQQTVPDIPQDLVRYVPFCIMPKALLHSRPGRACGVTPYNLWRVGSISVCSIHLPRSVPCLSVLACWRSYGAISAFSALLTMSSFVQR